MKVYVADFADIEFFAVEHEDPAVKDQQLWEFAAPKFTDVYSSLEAAVAGAGEGLKADCADLYGPANKESWELEFSPEDSRTMDRPESMETGGDQCWVYYMQGIVSMGGEPETVGALVVREVEVK